ncbi:MAG: ABC transporter permease [Spirochaetaceae bacterium]|jgi:rhamnose transport system permease protein|nr:ABC transporter permease [Spirochaetaceae bacterium]
MGSTGKIKGVKGSSSNIVEKFRELGLVIFIVLVSALVQARNNEFLTGLNIGQILTNTAILGILSVGMMMVLLTGGIDLSIGATMAFSGMVTALTVRGNPAVPPMVLVLEGTAIGAVAGLVIGILIARFSILPIIASLGLMNVIRGLTYMASKGQWVSAYQMSEGFKALATGRILGVNNLIITALVIYVLFYYFITYTRTGRRIYAVGSNPEAAEIIGLPRKRIVTLVYILMGALAGLSGVLWVAKFASAQGDTAAGYEMNVIAACVLGGVSVSGGRGKLSGLVLGVILFGILANALPLINVSPFWQQAIQGFVILAAILTNVLIKRNNDRAVLRSRNIRAAGPESEARSAS